MVGGTAVPIAVLALVASYLIGEHFGDVVVYSAVPLVVGLLIFFGACAIRARVFGRVPPDVEGFIPGPYKPIFLRWVLLRLGLFAAMLLLIAGTIVSGTAGYGVATGVQAIVYLVLIDIMAKVVFGTAMNYLLLRQSQPS